MTASAGFAALIADLLSPVGPVSMRRMFSGTGVYCDGAMLGFVLDDTLHLKTDATSRKEFEAEGCAPFVYQGRGRAVATSYWRVPERLLDDPDELVAWARAALAVARRKRAAPSRRTGSKATQAPSASDPRRRRPKSRR
jgi:DNA transformation protein